MNQVAGSIRFNTDSSKLEIYNGEAWFEIDATSPELQTGTSGLGAGGEPYTDTIEYWNIATTGNAIDFGNLTSNRQYCGNGQASSRTRGLFMGGREPSYVASIEFVTIAQTGNAANFGSLTDAGHYAMVGSSSTRAIAIGRYDGGSVVNVIDYVTIAQTGDAVDFGDLIEAGSDGAGSASPTRMLAFCGNNPSKTNTIQYKL